ncbi:cyclohexanecarboxylate-CoA ligase [Gordonia sp. TBRC 11910]|uniref:Cyclohexanecarboxylate-CoA ligase n=1 Tax=Gordonia asplenii TaxID=2725283 RepID=A0A848KTD0_9ACTN|nr:AMP-binding protein [Gordonia asplenii]NMO01429.1 cyclohexanecarboxylate-CoA ligase [Gordonia asplenii]
MPLTASRAQTYVEQGLWTDERIGDLVTNQAAKYPDRELFSFGGQRLTYGQFAAWTESVAATMVAAGVGQGDRILVQLPNCLEALVLQVAAFRIGAVNVPVVPIYREHETAQIIADSRPSVVAAAATLGSRTPTAEIDGALAEHNHTPRLKFAIDGNHDGWATVPGVDAPPPTNVPLPEPLAADQPALILYTSGTTSAPKGALLSSRALIAHLRNFADVGELDESTVLAAATPLSHLGGFIAGVIFPAYLGARSVIMPGWNADAAVEVIEREGVTLMMGATLFLQDLVDRYQRGAGPTHRLTDYMAAGATIPPSLIHDAQAVGIQATRCYGMTETAGICTAARRSDLIEQRAEWDGRILDGMEIESVDDLRQRLPAGQIGELRIRGPQLFDGYTDKVVTAAQIDSDGWFYPGDVGQVIDGWVRMTGRSKDIVNRGGEKFSTQDIESALLSHPDIAQAAVTAVPDDRFGEAVGAWISLHDGIEWDGAQKFLAHLDAMKLARAKLPVQWHVVASIPTTASGKIQKFRLVDLNDLATELAARLDN